MAGKKGKGSYSNSSTSKQKANNSSKPTSRENGSAKKASTRNDNTSGSGGTPLLVCLFVALCSLALGILTPHIIGIWKGQDQPSSIPRSSSKERDLGASQSGPPSITSNSSNTNSKNQATTRETAERSKKQQEPAMTVTQSTHEFPCDDHALADVLHEAPVVGLHVVCMDKSMASLKLTLFPEAQETKDPIKLEMEGLSEWTALKATLVNSLKLQTMDNLHQPWAMYSPDGELLVKEDDNDCHMEGLVQMGMVLIFQGGQFIWPGVRIGYKRTIDLYSRMPVGSPDTGGKHRTATLETISLVPLVFSVEGFLDADECDWIQEAAAPTMRYSEGRNLKRLAFFLALPRQLLTNSISA
jgi:hypothetical protein